MLPESDTLKLRLSKGDQYFFSKVNTKLRRWYVLSNDHLGTKEQSVDVVCHYGINDTDFVKERKLRFGLSSSLVQRISRCSLYPCMHKDKSALTMAKLRTIRHSTPNTVNIDFSFAVIA